MRHTATIAGALVLTALFTLTLGAQTIQRPKTSNILTKPSAATTAAAIKNNPSAIVGKASLVEIPLGAGVPDVRDINESGTVLINNATARTCHLWSAEGGLQSVSAQEENAEIRGVTGLGLNNKNQVVGFVEFSNGQLEAFFWDPEAGMKLLGTLGGPGSIAFDVNDSGLVAGQSLLAGAKPDSGAGISSRQFKEGIAIAWSEDMGMVPIGRFGTKMSLATSVNNAGVVAGYFGSHVYGREMGQSFTWTRAGGAEVIYTQYLFDSGDRIASAFSGILALNDAGAYAMTYTHQTTEGDRPAKGRGTLGVIGKGGGATGNFYGGEPDDITYKVMPFGINGENYVVGQQMGRHRGSSYASWGFVWRPGSEVIDLSDLTSGWRITAARAINSKYQVVATGEREGVTKALVLTLNPSLVPLPLAKSAVTKVSTAAIKAPPKIKIPPR